MNERIVKEPERAYITNRSAAQWWRDERDGKAPRRIRIGANAVGWKLSDIMSWIDSREVVTQANSKPVAPGAKRGRKPNSQGGNNYE